MSVSVTPTGLTPGVYNKLNSDYRLAVEKQRLHQSQTQQSMKRMEEAGVEPWAAKMARQLEKSEPATGEAKIRALLTYLYWSGAPCMRQPGLFGENKCLADMVEHFLEVSPLSDTEIQQRADIRARQWGYDQAFEGHDLDYVRRKFVAGSSEAQMAEEGFRAGQVFITASGKVAKEVAGEGRKRGRPTKAEQQAALAAKTGGVVQPKEEDETINLLKAETMGKAELAEHFNRFCERYGVKPVKTFESKSIGLERLRALKAKEIQAIHDQDDADLGPDDEEEDEDEDEGAEVG